MSEANTPGDWFALGDRNLQAARVLLASQAHPNTAYDQLALAAECYAKGAIMRIERLNNWPEKQLRPELYEHSLLKLVEKTALHIQIKALFNAPDRTSQEIYANYQACRGLNLRRYKMSKIPLNVVEDIYVALSDQHEGLAQWLKTR